MMERSRGRMGECSHALPFSVLGRYSQGMVLLDGKKLAEKMLGELKEEVAVLGKRLRLAIVVVGEDPTIRRFIKQKERAARAVGIDVRIYPFGERDERGEAWSIHKLRDALAGIVHEEKNTGVIVQLPLPANINRQSILNTVVPEKDVDVLSARMVGDFAVGKCPIMPPVVGAIKALLEEYQIDYHKKHVVILGAGILVGQPMTLWLRAEGVTFSVITLATQNPRDILRQADILITGIQEARYVTGDMVKEGVVVIDAGTSEDAGKEAGNVDFESVAPKSSFITPVPGGVGPLTVVTLLENVVTLAKAQ